MPMDQSRLWAKSNPAVALLDHLTDVRDAGEAAIGAIGPDLAAAVPGATDGLPRLLDVACWVHDLLKATTAFQRMVAGTGPVKQPIRHEVLAAVLLATDGPLRGWLEAAVPDVADRWAVVWAVAGHHLQMADPARNPAVPLVRDVDEPRFTAVLRAPDVRAALEAAGSGVVVPPLDDLPLDTAEEDEPGCLRDLAGRYVRDSVAVWKRLKREPRAGARVALLKGLLIAADVAGSAAPENRVSPAEWTRTALSLRLAPTDLEPVIRKGTKGEEPHDFQKAVGASDWKVTLVAAGCGNGKTTAAYLWAQRWAAGKKLFFTYPTTGTATAGYAGYLADQHQLLTDLIHMRAGVDLEAIRGTPKVEPADEAVVRIDSLRVWDRKVVVCTVDTVLGLLQCQRRGLYSLPAFLAGAVVFDEVHSYDRRLFGGLLRFLKEFPGIPALIMSASIPPGRLKRLKEVLGVRMPLSENKDAARIMLAALVKRVEGEKAGVIDRFADHRKRPLAAHLDDWQASLEASGRGEEYVTLKLTRVRAAFAGCGFAMPSDLSADRLEAFLRDLRVSKKRSIQTANDWLQAVRQFCRWMVANERLDRDPFTRLRPGNVKLDQRHRRGEFTPAEIGRFLAAAEASTVTFRGLTGADRRMIYRVALGTGLRAAEIAALVPDHFDLDAAPPTVILPAEFTKNRKGAVQPIPAGLTAELRTYLHGRPRKERLWPRTWAERSADMLRIDLAAAGVAVKVDGPEGIEVRDFHALRNCYISDVLRAGADLKQAMTLARHSDPRLTTARYARTRLHDLGSVVDRLPAPNVTASQPALLRATGTTG